MYSLFFSFFQEMCIILNNLVYLFNKNNHTISNDKTTKDHLMEGSVQHLFSNKII